MVATRSFEMVADGMLTRVREHLALVPDVRADRVAQARAVVAAGLPSSAAIASRIISCGASERACRFLPA
jgi:hypothetical protein